MNLSMIYRYNNGTVKAFGFQSHERIGVEAITPMFSDFYTGEEKNRLYFLNWRHMLSPSLLMTATASCNQFENNQKLAALDLETRDRVHTLRLDLNYTINSRFNIKTGIEHQQIAGRHQGTAPYDPNDIQGTGLLLDFNKTTSTGISGGYAEAEIQVMQRLAFNYGYRFDYQRQSNDWIEDPRLSLVYQFKTDHALRVAVGRFHQFPDTWYYDSFNGNPDLNAMQAVHYIAGWEWKPQATLVRLEGYYKNYQNLILENSSRYYANGGHGYARGIDFFVKRNTGLISGWSSYSFLQSKRKEFLYHDMVPTDYDITHHFKLSTKINLSPIFNLAIGYRYASGRPFHSGYGKWNSQRGPAYQKMDVTASYLVSFFKNNLTVFYVSVSNLLGHENITDYTYSADYNRVYKRKSLYRQSVYFGVSFNFE